MSALVLGAAVVLAISANLLVYVVVTGPLDEPLLMPSQDPPPELTPLGAEDVLIFSTIFGVGAIVVYAIVRARSARPLRVFAILASVVLFGSLALPAAIPSPPVEWSAKLVLMAMHAVGYVVILGALWLGHERGWLHRRGAAI